MKRATLILTVCLILISPLTAAIDIVFDYSYDANNFFDPNTANGQAARARMTDVIADLDNDGCLDDFLLAVAPDASNHWTPRFTNPATGSMQSGTYDMSVPADTLIIYLGGRNMSSLGIGGSGGYSASGFQPWFDLLDSRGENPSTDFGPWGGAISFDTVLDSGYSWNFSADEPGFMEYDFLSVAQHELAHVLGMGSADSWNNLVSGNTFVGTNAMAVYGDAVPLDGIGSHWAEGTMSVVDGVVQEAAMDPNISNGQRKYFTYLDKAALADIGWDRAPGSTLELAPTFDAKADFSSGGSSLVEGESTVNVQQVDFADVDRRGVLEFNISEIPDDATITSATLELEIVVMSSGSGYPVLSLHGYAGNGTLEIADGQVPSNLIGQSDPILSLDIISIDVDASYIESLLSSTDFLGLLTLNEENYSQAAFVTIEGAIGSSWIEPKLIIEYTTESALLAGDANRDGVVSAGDYASVQANFGSTGAAGILGDANGDGVVSAGDYASVQANFGSTASSPAPAPEPTTMALLVLGGVAILRRPRRR